MVKVESIVRENQLSHEEHLVSVDFVSVEVVSDQTSIRVGLVEALLDGEIRQITEKFVNSAVLSIGSIQVSTSISVRSVFAQQALEHQHGVVVFMSPSRSVEEASDIDVGHFVVSHEQHGGSEAGLFSVLDFKSAGDLVGESAESVFNSRGEFFVVDVTSTDDNDVGADVVGLMEFDDLVSGDGTNIFSDTEDRLSHHMVSVTGVERGFKSGLELVLLDFDTFSVDRFSFSFNLVFIVDGVAEDVAEKFNSLASVLLADSDGIFGSFSASSGIELASEAGDSRFNIFLASVGGSSEIEMFEEMRDTRGLDGLLSASGLDEDGDGDEVAVPVLGGNSGSITKLSGLGFSVESQSFRDFSGGKISEIGESMLRELELLESSKITRVVSGGEVRLAN